MAYRNDIMFNYAMDSDIKNCHARGASIFAAGHSERYISKGEYIAKSTYE